MSRAPRPIVQCRRRECQKWFLVREGSGRPRSFCSRRCKNLDDGGRGEPARQRRDERRARRDERVYERAERRGLQAERECAWCHEAFWTRQPDAAYCSRQCQGREQNRRRVADGRNRRRLRASPYHQYRFGVVATGDPISPLDVFERDGWRCRICRCTVDAELPRTHPRKAILGHIVAVAAGGQHTWENVCCLCHRCNSKDGVNRLPIQLHVA